MGQRGGGANGSRGRPPCGGERGGVVVHPRTTAHGARRLVCCIVIVVTSERRVITGWRKSKLLVVQVPSQVGICVVVLRSMMAVETGVAVVVRKRRVPVSREVLLVTFVQVSVLVGQVTVCEISAVSVAVVEGGEGVARCWRRGSDVPVWVAGEVVRILRGGGRVGELGVGNIDVGMVQEEPISTYVLILTTIHPLQMSVKTSVEEMYERISTPALPL